MSDKSKLINIDSGLSKIVLNSIIKKDKIDYKKLKILSLKKKIEDLRKEYLKMLKSLKPAKNDYKYYIFWELIKKKFRENRIVLKKRIQQKKEEKMHILFSDFGKALGFNPSLLFLLIHFKEIQKFITGNEIYNKIKKIADIEELGNEEKIRFMNVLLKKEITLVTPLCPDYEHIKIGEGYYKYTFNKLGSGLGLIGKRLIIIINKLHEILDSYNIEYKHQLLYGDFESYSKNICKRLKVDEKEFNLRLSKSVKKMKKASNKKCKVGLIVKNLTSKKEWKIKCRSNAKKLHHRYKIDIRSRRLIEQISNSRAMLYSSWFPNLKKEKYNDLVIQQGAEYASMGDMFYKKFNNPIVLGLDHPKMKPFYNLNVDITVLYGKPRYL